MSAAGSAADCAVVPAFASGDWLAAHRRPLRHIVVLAMMSAFAHLSVGNCRAIATGKEQEVISMTKWVVGGA